MIDIVIHKGTWDELDANELIEWLSVFCKADEFEMHEVNGVKWDTYHSKYVGELQSVRFTFQDPKTAMAFKLAWGGK